MRGAGALATTALASTAMAEGAPLVLPSGLSAQLHEVLTDRPGNGLVYRFRFIAEGFDPRADQIETVLDDLVYLCTEYALDRVSEIGPAPRQVVISLANKATEFGVVDPAARQVFEAFTVEDGTCMWEMF